MNRYTKHLREWQKQYLERSLATCDGNVTYTANTLGVSRPNLYRLCARVGVVFPSRTYIKR